MVAIAMFVGSVLLMAGAWLGAHTTHAYDYVTLSPCSVHKSGMHMSRVVPPSSDGGASLSLDIAGERRDYLIGPAVVSHRSNISAQIRRDGLPVTRLTAEEAARVVTFQPPDSRFAVHWHGMDADFISYLQTGAQPPRVLHWDGIAWAAVLLLACGALISSFVVLLRASIRLSRTGDARFRCANCGYSLRGLRSSRCPECGGEVAAATPAPSPSGGRGGGR